MPAQQHRRTQRAFSGPDGAGRVPRALERGRGSVSSSVAGSLFDRAGERREMRELNADLLPASAFGGTHYSHWPSGRLSDMRTRARTPGGRRNTFFDAEAPVRPQTAPLARIAAARAVSVRAVARLASTKRAATAPRPRSALEKHDIEPAWRQLRSSHARRLADGGGAEDDERSPSTPSAARRSLKAAVAAFSLGTHASAKRPLSSGAVTSYEEAATALTLVRTASGFCKPRRSSSSSRTRSTSPPPGSPPRPRTPIPTPVKVGGAEVLTLDGSAPTYGTPTTQHQAWGTFLDEPEPEEPAWRPHPRLMARAIRSPQRHKGVQHLQKLFVHRGRSARRSSG